MLRDGGDCRDLELSLRAPDAIWANLLLCRGPLCPERALTHLRHVKVVSIALILLTWSTWKEVDIRHHSIAAVGDFHAKARDLHQVRQSQKETQLASLSLRSWDFLGFPLPFGLPGIGMRSIPFAAVSRVIWVLSLSESYAEWKLKTATDPQGSRSHYLEIRVLERHALLYFLDY